uniref:Uncharacterized protein n=1 Tax=Angiostrongylus cantonensis TaxID=6313 RepID=A0A0K0DE98_ANGCA
MSVCFMMVFCSLLEYAAVGYINKRMKLNENKKQRPPLLMFSEIEYMACLSATDERGELYA